jgi:peptidoglycan pentaglycine glycine transferase (the first glycine)
MDKQEWNTIIRQFSQTSLLQTWEWGEHKSRYGWNADHKTWQDEKGNIIAAALILTREQVIPLIGKKVKIFYIPKGPLLDWEADTSVKVLQELEDYTCQQKAIYIKIDPDLITAKGVEGNPGYESFPSALNQIQRMKERGWLISKQQIQFKNTFWVDLKPSEDELLADMKQKTRYNIHLAEKKGVKVHQAETEDLDLIYEMYAETANRDDFIIRPKDYYISLWTAFMSAGMATPLVAEVNGDLIAGLFLFHFGERSWYIYGMSRNLHREKMPNYLLQWEAIQLSKSYGCSIYDLWGAPDVFDENDRMWGVYKFKEGLGGKVIQTVGALDYPASKFKYKIVQNVLPQILTVTRKIRRRQIQNELTD